MNHLGYIFAITLAWIAGILMTLGAVLLVEFYAARGGCLSLLYLEGKYIAQTERILQKP